MQGATSAASDACAIWASTGCATSRGPSTSINCSRPDLVADFPPLRSLDALPNNLPLQLTSFVGREKEIAEITALIEKHRLVTLVGSGGVGKTRTSLQVAANLLDGSGDGVWFIEFAPLDQRRVHSVDDRAGARA